MIRISLCMIVKDEEEVLGRCLDSASGLVDEVVIVDTGSSDRTKEIAGRYTERIYDFPWINDFSAARNYAFEKARMEYCMWLDADDVIAPEAAERFREMKERLEEDVDMVMLPYQTAFDEAGRPVFTYYRERIVRNVSRFRFQGRVHEAITPAGKICYEEIPVEHQSRETGISTRNLDIYRNMEEQGEFFDGRSLYYYGRELITHGEAEKAEEILQTFLDRPDGWIENKIEATRQIAWCRYRQGREEEALEALLWGLKYDLPRGETCCDLGKHFLDREQYQQAIYWYQQALKSRKKAQTGAFVQEDCYGFLPAISLCVCFDRLGDGEQARKYNELAGSYKPESEYYLRNRKYFEGLEAASSSDVSILA